MNFSFGWTFHLVILVAMQFADQANCAPPPVQSPQASQLPGPEIVVHSDQTSELAQPKRRPTLNTAGLSPDRNSIGMPSTATTTSEYVSNQLEQFEDLFRRAEFKTPAWVNWPVQKPSLTEEKTPIYEISK